MSAIFRWAQRFKSSAQDRIAVVAAQMGWMEFAKARLSRDFQSLNTLQNTLRELDAYGECSRSIVV